MQRWQNWLRLGICFSAALCLCGVGTGCQRSTTTSVRIYESDDAPQGDRQQDEQLDSEYKMVSPGEMTSPGEIVNE